MMETPEEALVGASPRASDRPCYETLKLQRFPPCVKPNPSGDSPSIGVLGMFHIDSRNLFFLDPFLYLLVGFSLVLIMVSKSL